jgi:hypothetical protein
MASKGSGHFGAQTAELRCQIAEMNLQNGRCTFLRQITGDKGCRGSKTSRTINIASVSWIVAPGKTRRREMKCGCSSHALIPSRLRNHRRVSVRAPSFPTNRDVRNWVPARESLPRRTPGRHRELRDSKRPRLAELDPDVPCPCMPNHIGQSLLNHSEAGNRQIARYIAQLSRNLSRYASTLLVLLRHPP